MEILNKLKKTIFFVLLIIYEEIVFSLFVYKQFPTGIVYIVLFSIPIGIAIELLTSIFNQKVNKVISYILVSLFCFIFAAQFVYNKIYQSIISMYSLKNGGQVFQFYETIIGIIKSNPLTIILMLLPIVILILLHIFKKLDFEKTTLKNKLVKIGALIIVQIVATIIVNVSSGSGMYSDKNLYNNSNSLLLTAKRFGICTTMRLDFKRLIFGSEDSLQVINRMIAQEKEELKPDVDYNKTDIDFGKLAQSESDSNVAEIHKYFDVQNPSEKNEYTGMFEGKNLIVIIGESFSNIGIKEDITPTLYKLSKEGFEFKNFYAPLYPVSTADGEYMTDNSLIPKEGVWSMTAVRNNYIPYSYANLFEKLGYSSNSYHDHTATYYERDKYMEAMGYDSYLAVNNGLEERMDCSRWPNSDLEMVQVTTEDYMNNEKFLAYYMTVSGHLEYTREGNYIVDKNWDLVENLPYSDRAKGYLATQIELDKAVEQLIKSLEEKGKLEDTVIVITGDHYPYGLGLDQVNELSTYTRDDEFEKHNMPLIIWSGSMEEPVVVEKTGSNLDILPTVLNLFGIEYDSRLLMGRDLLSNSEPTVIFANRSFITDKIKYNAVTGEVINLTNEAVSEEYVNKMKTIVEGKIQISRLILEKDYYRKIQEYLTK